jgi:cobyrinic acid a,c-diamide synthase
LPITPVGLPPRVVIAGTHSGVGKTTLATGIMAAFTARNLSVASAKVGPDFIDPGYHAIATGRPAHNLDGWICGAGAVAPLAALAGANADLLVVEGVMGLFDGAGWLPDAEPEPPPGGPGPNPAGNASTADAAMALDAPVILVVDASSMSTSVAALVHGFRTFDPDLRLAGVILNQVGSDHHESLLREALAPLSVHGVPVLGVLHRDDSFRWRDRHLGLVPVVERPNEIRASIDQVARAIDRSVDLDAILLLARDAPTMPSKGIGALPSTRRMTPPGTTVRIAVAGGKAFSFAYPDNLRRLVESGAELVPFDPLVDTDLPQGIAGLYAGGGFPEVFADALNANRPLLASVRRQVSDGLVTWAECGGMLWLASSLDDRRQCDAIDASGRMGARLTLGYRTAVATVTSPVAAAGTSLRGHEFHYSTIDPPGRALALTGRSGSSTGGFATPTLLASYLHLHLGADPTPAERFVAASMGASSLPVT